MLFTIMAAAILMSLFSATARAQDARMVAQAKAQGPCRDAWITVAIWRVNASTSNPQGVAGAGECDPNLYGGRWSSFAELASIVDSTYRSLHNNGYSFKVLSDGRVGGTTSVVMLQNGSVKGQQTVSNSMIGQDGAGIARVIAAGGGNLIGNAGGLYKVGNSSLSLRNGDVAGIVIDNSSNIGRVVGTAGGSIARLPSVSFNPSSGYGIQSTGQGRLPKATIVIQ
jgi:hypothetical protein